MCFNFSIIALGLPPYPRNIYFNWNEKTALTFENIYRCDIPSAFSTLYFFSSHTLTLYSIPRVATIVIFLHFQSCLLIHLKYAHKYLSLLAYILSHGAIQHRGWHLFWISHEYIHLWWQQRASCFLFKWQKTYSLKAINYLKIHGEIWSICVYTFIFFERLETRRKIQ